MLPPAEGRSLTNLNARVLAGLAARGARVRALALGGLPKDGGSDPFARAHPEIEVEWLYSDVLARSRDLYPAKRFREEVGGSIRARLSELIERERCDVLFVVEETIGWCCAGVARAHRVPWVVGLHSGELLDATLKGSLPPDVASELLSFYRQVDRLIVVAHHFAEGITGLGLEDVVVIRNPVDNRCFVPVSKDRSLLGSLGLQKCRSIVLSFGRIEPEKRPLDVVASAARCLRQQPGLAYVVVGDGSLRPALEAACREAGIMDCFRFVGWVDHEIVPHYLALADLVLLPSKIEVQSLTCLEAQACGRVVLASDIPGNRELIADGETGLLFPLGDVEALAEMTLMTLRSPDLRAAIGRRARRAAKLHDADRVADAYFATLGEVADGSGASG